MDASALNSPELQRFLEEEKQKAMVSEMVGKLTNVCWDKCITGSPGSKFSSSETACLSNCAQRYMDLSIIIMKRMNCALKTSIADALTDALKYYYFDSDSLVAQAAGGEIDPESLRQADESGFRDSETEVLKQLSSMGRLVGDGAVQGATNLSYLRYGISVWLDVPLNILVDDDIKSRASQSMAQNPSSADSYLEVQDELVRRYEELKKGYANADATVSLQRSAVQLGYDDLNAVTSEDLALEVLEQIEKLIRVKKMMEEAAKPF